jgi:hypothetical protein
MCVNIRHHINDRNETYLESDCKISVMRFNFEGKRKELTLVVEKFYKKKVVDTYIYNYLHY